MKPPRLQGGASFVVLVNATNGREEKLVPLAEVQNGFTTKDTKGSKALLIGPTPIILGPVSGAL